MPINFSWTFLLIVLQKDKAHTKIPLKYADYTNVFFVDLIIELLKNIGMNKHTIELIKNKQSSYKPIYSLSLIELKTLKVYIEIHLKTRFI